jgi:hypothetical protein
MLAHSVYLSPRHRSQVRETSRVKRVRRKKRASVSSEPLQPLPLSPSLAAGAPSAERQPVGLLSPGWVTASSRRVARPARALRLDDRSRAVTQAAQVHGEPQAAQVDGESSLPIALAQTDAVPPACALARTTSSAAGGVGRGTSVTAWAPPTLRHSQASSLGSLTSSVPSSVVRAEHGSSTCFPRTRSLFVHACLPLIAFRTHACLPPICYVPMPTVAESVPSVI